MADDLRQLETWAGALLTKLESAERRKLARIIGTDLRRTHRQRIANQKNPDGTAYEPRKSRNLRGKSGRIKRRKMFTKLRTAKYLKVRTTPNSVAAGFFGRTARVARVHHYGLRERSVRYPARELVGFSPADQERVRDLLLQHFVGKLHPH